MNEFELFENRGMRYAEMLQAKSTRRKHNHIYISYYFTGGNILFSVRYNEMNNRVNNLELTTMLFTVKELMKKDISDEMPRNFSFWPARSNGLAAIYSTFVPYTYYKVHRMSSNDRPNPLIARCKAWNDEILNYLNE